MHAKRELYIFTIYYALIYMTVSIFGSYISVYYLYKGFTVFQIGMLQAIGPLSSVFILPMWAAASDRARFKTTILKAVIIGSICAIVLYRRVSGFYATAVVTMIFMTFYTSIVSLGDAIAVDRIIKLNGKFTTVRLCGTLGYALTVILAGSYFRNHITNMFYVAAVFLFLDFLIVCFFRKKKAET
jgi:PPP family 3-phenylpropionic acid transporter